MLDTNIIPDLTRNPMGKAAKRIARVGEANICTSIIAHACVAGSTIVTANTDELKRIRGLKVENWRA